MAVGSVYGLEDGFGFPDQSDGQNRYRPALTADSADHRYKPETLSNWPAGDPGSSAQAHDIHASRLTAVEGASASATSAVFMTDVTDADGTPTVNYESGTVPSNQVVSSVEYQSGELTVTIHGEVDGGPEDWNPVVTIVGANVSGSPVSCTLSALGTDTRRFSFSQAVTLTGAGTVTVTADDGATHAVSFTEAAAPPDITTFTHGTVAEYQPTQTRVKNGDTVSFSATFPAGASYFVLEDFELHGSVSAVEYPIDVTDTSIDDTFTVSGDNGLSHNIKAHLKMASEAVGSSMESTNSGLFHDSSVPSVSGTISVGNYPSGQEALKDSETADCTFTVSGSQADTGNYTDWSTIEYTTVSGELLIPDDEVYDEIKTVSRASGDYRETGTNYQVRVYKSYNGTYRTRTATVKIAHTFPTVTVGTSGGGQLSRMGTDDGVDNYKNHIVYLISSQANLSTHTPTLAGDAGDTSAWTGAWSTYGSLAYSNYRQVQDADLLAGGQAGNSFTWGACSIKNRAGKETTAVTTHTTYTLGGFEARSVVITGYQNRGTFDCRAVDVTNLSAEVTGVGVLSYRGDTTETGGGMEFTITDSAGTFDEDGTYVRCLDPNVFGVLNPYTIVIEESP